MKLINQYFLILILGLSFVGEVQAQKQTPPEGGTPQDFKLPAKDIKKLDNGLSTTLVQYGAIPKVDINVIIKTGNIHEAADEVWLADLAASLMREGTTSMDFKTIAKKVAAMGGEVNISTGPNQTTISGSVLSEFGPDLIRILADIVMNPSFPASEIDRLKNDLKRQLTVQKSVPQAQAVEKFRTIIYKDHSYGRIFPTAEMIDSYTLEKVKAFYDENFGAKRTVVYAVGKFDEAQVTKAIDDVFGKWKEGPEVDYPIATPVKTNEVAMIDRPNAPQTTVMLGLPTLDPSKSDYLPLTVANSLLGGSFGSRITSNIREDKGYTYSPRSVINAGYRTAIWYEQADVTSEHTGASLQEIAKEIKRLQAEAPSKEELEGIQNYEAGVFVLQNSTPQGIISQLNFLDFHGLDDSYLTDRVKNIYQVTPEKVQQMAKDYFQYEDMTLVLVGDKKQLEQQIKSHQEALKVK
ncbi:MAG TPA: pitrilysin family protein [Chryseosolibacter sp.]